MFERNRESDDPPRSDYITLMIRAGGAERALVEEGMRNRDPACQMSIDGRVYITVGRRPHDMITGDPVDDLRAIAQNFASQWRLFLPLRPPSFTVPTQIPYFGVGPTAAE